MATVTAEDQAKALALIRDLKTQASEVLDHVNGQIAKVEQGTWNTAKGISFLEVKYHMLLSYLINLTQLLCNKVKGQSIKENPAIERLVEIRTVLEKIRPIDKKLKYQVDKLLKTATTGTLGESDPLRFKPNPDNLQSKFDNQDGSDQDSADDKRDTSKVYRPPKLAAMAYGEDTVKERQEKTMKRAQKRALSSSIMKDLKDEYYDGPEEIRDTADLHRNKVDKSGKERTEYEEKYLLRTAVSKKEKNASKKLRTITGLDDLTRFGDMSALTDTPGMEGLPTKKRKKSTPGKKKGSKASKKWKRRM